MSIGDALGDLSVTIKALSALPTPPFDRSHMATFAAWFDFGERFFHQVIDVGVQLEVAGRAPTPEELSPLVAVAGECGWLISELCGKSSEAFGYIGYEYGYLYGGAEWRKLCLWHSAAEFIAQLLASVPRHEIFDFSSTREGMAHWGHELFEPVEVPAGMPRSHWWWFEDRPPTEPGSV